MKTIYEQAEISTTQKIKPYDKYYLWKKGRNFARIFKEYINVPVSKVLFVIRPSGEYTEIAIFENPPLKTLEKYVFVTEETAKDFESLCNEYEFAPVNIIFSKEPRQQTKWTFRIVQ